jgi:WD40 repeat protein
VCVCAHGIVFAIGFNRSTHDSVGQTRQSGVNRKDTNGDGMRKLLMLPMLASVLGIQTATELVVSVGHSGAPSHAAFVGNYLATAMWSNVALIDLTTGLTVSHLPQGSLVLAMEESPAGDLLAVGSCNHSIQLWNVRSRTLVRRFALTQECAESLSFSPDGVLLATGSYGCCSSDKGLQVLDVRSGKLVRQLAQGSGIRHVVFSGDGRWVAGVDDKGKASVFEWPSGRQLRTYDGLEQPGYSHSVVLASRDGRYLAWLGSGLRVWDVPSDREIRLPGARRVDMHDKPPGKPERRWSEELVTAMAPEFLDDGRLAFVDDDEQMAVMQLPDGPQQTISRAKLEFDVRGDVRLITPQSWLKVRRDGLSVAGSRDLRTVIWDVAAARVRALTAPALTSPTSLRWSRTGVLAWADLESGLRGWDDRLGKPANFDREIDSASSLAFRPDGARLAVSDGSSMYILDFASRRLVASRELPPATDSGVAFSPDGNQLAFEFEGFSAFDSHLRPRRRISTLEEYTSVEHVAFSPDGQWIAAGLGGPTNALRVWPAAGSGAAITLDTIDVTYGPQPPAFSSDSRRLASFRRGSSLTIWATASWDVARSWTIPGTGRALAFAPEGARLAIACDGEAAIWDADSGRKLVTFAVPGSVQMQEIAWSPDGQRVVSSADDGVLRFWSSTDGRLLASLYMLASDGDWLVVSPDGRLDGTEEALARLIAWRAGERVTVDRALTERHRVPGLWRFLSRTTPPR